MEQQQSLRRAYSVLTIMMEVVKGDPEGWAESRWKNASLPGASSLVSLDPRRSSRACTHTELLPEEATQWVGQASLEQESLE